MAPRLLTEAVRGGHCDPAAVLAQLRHAELLDGRRWPKPSRTCSTRNARRPSACCTGWCASTGLAEPLWNVDLRLPGGPHLGAVDAYWPEQALALELDTPAPRTCGARDGEDVLWAEFARRRDHLERLGITVVRVSPWALCTVPQQQATVVRTALMAADDREPAAYVRVLPR